MMTSIPQFHTINGAHGLSSAPYSHTMSTTPGYGITPQSGVPAYGSGPPSVNTKQVGDTAAYSKPTTLLIPKPFPSKKNNTGEKSLDEKFRSISISDQFQEGELAFVMFGAELSVKHREEVPGSKDPYAAKTSTKEGGGSCNGYAASGSDVNSVLKTFVSLNQTSEDDKRLSAQNVIDLFNVLGANLLVRSITRGTFSGRKRGSIDDTGVQVQNSLYTRCLNAFILTNPSAPRYVGSSVYVIAVEHHNHMDKEIKIFGVCDNGVNDQLNACKDNNNNNNNVSCLNVNDVIRAFQHNAPRRTPNCLTVVLSSAKRCIGRILLAADHRGDGRTFNDEAFSYWVGTGNGGACPYNAKTKDRYRQSLKMVTVDIR